MASMQPELGQTVYTGSAGSNFSHLVQFHSCAKLAWIQSGWPGQVLDKLIWSGSTPVCKNHWAQFVAECNWPATSFPLSNSVTFFHGWPGLQRENQPRSDLVLADCIRLSPSGSGPEASWYAKMIQPIFDQYFRSDLAWTCIGSSMFTVMSGSCHKYNFCHDKHTFVETNMCLS